MDFKIVIHWHHGDHHVRVSLRAYKLIAEILYTYVAYVPHLTTVNNSIKWYQKQKMKSSYKR